MTERQNESATTDKRRQWVEPEITGFNVRDTTEFPGTGGDLEYTLGHDAQPDCTRS